MILKCPFCSYPYLVENEGKYQCGVCGSKYYYVSGQVMMWQKHRQKKRYIEVI